MNLKPAEEWDDRIEEWDERYHLRIKRIRQIQADALRAIAKQFTLRAQTTRIYDRVQVYNGLADELERDAYQLDPRPEGRS